MADRLRSDGEGSPMTFIPGEDPGGYALGITHHPDDLGRLAAYRDRLDKMQTGANVARVFPWLRNVKETIVAGDQVTIWRNNWPATFYNNSDHLVEISEIRIRHGIDSTRSLNYQTAMLCKLEIQGRNPIITDWMPVEGLNTEYESTAFTIADLDSYVYELPAPYLLQRANQFVMDVRYNVGLLTNNLPAEYSVMLGLHGVGLHDEEPISLIRPVVSWPNVTGTAGQWQSVPFDEMQGRPMRDALITHITFGAAFVNNSTAGIIEQLDVRPIAPEGPSWHQGEFFEVRDIAEHISMYRDDPGHGTLGYWMVHRPIVPYRLERGEGLNVSLWNRAAFATTASVTLRGTQVGMK